MSYVRHLFKTISKDEANKYCIFAKPRPYRIKKDTSSTANQISAFAIDYL